MTRFVLPVALAACTASAAPGPTAPTRTPTVPIPPAAAVEPPSAEPPQPPPRTWRPTGAEGQLLTHDGPFPPSSEWRAAHKATVWGLSALGCSARTTATWMRIRCPFGLNHPADPTMFATGNGAWQVAWTDRSVELMLPIGPGLETNLILDAHERFELALQWRLRAPRPPVLGYVNEAELPECAGKLPGAGAAHHSQVEDCRRAGHDDCDGLAKCLRGEPSHRPLCPSGWQFQAYCTLPCSSPKDCGPGWTCGDGPAGTPVCLELR